MDGRATLLLGHGAGGGVGAPDLVAVTATALEAGVHVVLVEQPYRVAGRRAPAPAHQLDTAWLAVVSHVHADIDRAELFDARSGGARSGSSGSGGAGARGSDGPVGRGPVLFGGRSSGARVACRTAGEGGAAGVLCLAFPVHPPGRPEKDRLPELASPTVPILVVQGERDPFGVPAPAPGRDVIVLRGDHSLRCDAPGLRAAVTSWLARVVPAG